MPARRGSGPPLANSPGRRAMGGTLPLHSASPRSQTEKQQTAPPAAPGRSVGHAVFISDCDLLRLLSVGVAVVGSHLFGLLCRDGSTGAIVHRPGAVVNRFCHAKAWQNQDAPFSPSFGAAGNDAQKLHAPPILPFFVVRHGAHKVLCPPFRPLSRRKT